MRHREIPSFVYDPSLVFYLPMWKRDGAAFVSDDAYGHLATVTGALWTLQGRTFNGVGDQIGVNYSSQLTISSLTCLAWIKLVGDAGWIVTMPYAATHQAPWVGYSIRENGTDGTLGYYNNYDGTDIFSVGATGGVPKNVWHYVALTVASGAQEMTVDGVSYKTSTTAYTSINYSGSPRLSLGTRNIEDAGENWQGDIGEVFIYNRVLTPSEIQQTYLATKWRYG